VSEQISLREITRNSLSEVIGLSVDPAHEAFVANNAISIAEAHFHPEAWFRTIYAREEPVGFLMLHDEHLLEHPRQEGLYFLWRLMIDSRFQGRGYGRLAIEALVPHVRSRPQARRLLTSCLQGPGSPLSIYLKAEFSETGEQMDGEIELARSLAPGAAA
jgi:diamine N-acetyltransferase